MEPQPVDLNKLKSILAGSKTIMNKVESNNFTTGNIDPRALTEDGVRELQSEGITRPMQQKSSSIGYTEDMVKNSNLPPIVKEAMLKNPIPQITSPNYTFSLEDVSELSNEKQMGYPRVPKTTPSKSRTINESVNNSDLITISRTELKEMISEAVNKELIEFFAKNYNSMVTEQAVKKTIGLLIKEGKIPQKKKTI